MPGVELGTQDRSWADERWRYVGSVLDGFAAGPTGRQMPIRRLLLTLGTIPYCFRRLAERVAKVVPSSVTVTSQVGATDVRGLELGPRREMPAAELRRAMADADVVVAHAGTGSALAALEAGKCAVLVPRESAHGEHVDDHQRQLADELGRRGLAIARRVSELTLNDLDRAAAIRINRVEAPPLLLDGPPREERRATRARAREHECEPAGTAPAR
jgi:UDP-N-acetylglucosamine--N-acetylmuramyl-(pentapeptide) pyrophosphoryl-undecaprenol N-acetylglucosamine transferase